MARVANIFTGNTAIPFDGFGSWVFTGATPVIHKEDVPINVTSMVLLRPTLAATPVQIELASFQIPEDYRGDSVDFGFYIKSDSKIEITIEAANDSIAQEIENPNSKLFQEKTIIPAKGAWVFPRVNLISTGNIATPQFITLTITITNHGATPIYFARPVLTPTYYHLDDAATDVLQAYIPSEWLEVDLQAENVVGALGKLLQVMSVAYQDCYYLHNEIQNLDHIDSWNNGVTEFSSTLVSPEYVKKDKARWLAQFVGTVLIDPSAGLTPWANLPKVWQNWQNIDTPDPDLLVDWSEVEGYNIELIGIEEYFQWQIATQAYSANGGTYGAMRAAAQRVLSDTKTVIITHHPTLDWTILVRTKLSETNPLLLVSAIYGAKPAGFDIVINDVYLP